NILPGCEGTELFFLLFAGVVAFPASWRARVTGLAIGLPIVLVFNVFRVTALYAIVRYAPAEFELAHGYVAPTFFVVSLGVLFRAWTLWASGSMLHESGTKKMRSKTSSVRKRHAAAVTAR